MVRRVREKTVTKLVASSCYANSDGTLVIEHGTRCLVVPFGKPIRAKWTPVGEHFWEGTMKRREAQSNEQGTAPLDPLMQRYPNLYDFLTDTQWDDGKPRETGTILIFVQEGRYKACLNDRDADASCFVSAVNLEALLLTADEAINDSTVEWRDKGSPPRRRR